MNAIFRIRIGQLQVARGIIVGDPAYLLELERSINIKIPQFKMTLFEMDENHPLNDIANRMSGD